MPSVTYIYYLNFFNLFNSLYSKKYAKIIIF